MIGAEDGADRMLALLGGKAAPPEPQLDLPLLQARLIEDDDDVDARDALLALIHARTLPARLAAAMAEDGVDVVLRDGSTMGRAAAERALAVKEEAIVYPPLRTPLLQARRRAFDPVADRVAFDDVAASLGLPKNILLRDELVFLRGFLSASAPLAAPALEVLAGSAGPVGDAAALVRALDRPAGAEGGDAVAVEIVRVTRGCLPPDARPLQRRAAPRALAGHIVDGGDAVRVLWAESLRLGRQRSLLMGVGWAYARLGAVTEVAAGLGLMLQAPPVRRTVGGGGAQAAGLWREAVACTLVKARLAAAAAVAFADAEVDPEAPARERLAMRQDAAARAVKAAVGVAGGELVDDALAPPWPDGIRDDDAPSAAAWRARQLAAAAADVLLLRDIGDEGLLLRPRCLGTVREALGDRPHLPPDRAAAAWQDLLAEVA